MNDDINNKKTNKIMYTLGISSLLIGGGLYLA